jgi:hypothetical protein
MTPFEQAELRAHRFGLMAAIQSSMKELINLSNDCDAFMNEYQWKKIRGKIDESLEEMAIAAKKDQIYANDSLREIAERVEKHFGISA